MITVATSLYMLGVLLVLSIFEVEEGRSSVGLLVMALGWPLVTIHIALCDIFFPDQE